MINIISLRVLGVVHVAFVIDDYGKPRGVRTGFTREHARRRTLLAP